MYFPQPKWRRQNLNWRQRIAAIRNLKPLFGMIVEASPKLALASLLLRTCRAMAPLFLLWVGKLILDNIVRVVSHRHGQPALIWKLVWLEIGIVVLNDVFGRLNTLCDSLLGDHFTNVVSIRLMRHAAALDLSQFEDAMFQDKLDRARRQSGGRLTLLACILNVAQDALTLAVLSAGLITFSPWLILLLLVAILPSFLGETHLTTLAYSVLYRNTPQRRQLDYLRFLGASAQTAKEVKAFGLGEHLAERYEGVSTQIYEENKAMAVKRAGVAAALNVVSTGGYYVAYSIVLIRTISGVVSIGMFAFLTGAFARSRAVIERMLDNLNDISEQALFLRDLFELFELRPAICAPANPVIAPRVIRYGFEFRNVSFAYAGSARLVVRNVTFALHPGEKVGLVGENGAGKTTLVKLLTRLYDPIEGAILLDGVDLREYDPEDLREQISVVFQDYLRYDMFVRENIGFGKIDSLYDDMRLEKAAQKSLAKRLIDRFPDGYDQMLGHRFEGGLDLSGGEWQRLALARAYMRDAQLIVVDEPTAALDARAEYEVFQRFAEVTRNRMAVLISHRFSTVRMADRILVLADGLVTEQGTHEQLMALGGHYSELFELQATGYR